MKLKYLYSAELEAQRVKQTIGKSELFKKFNYKLFFPDGFNLDSKDFANLNSQIEKEMIPDRIEEIKQEITDKWVKNSTYIDSLLGSVPYKIPDTLVISLTQYGVGGSYWLPNKVIVNINYTWLDYFETIMHELIHLLIEKPLVQKYDLSHKSKEALIDYICSHNKYLKNMFPDYPVQKDFVSSLPDKNIIDKLTWLYG